MKKSDWSDKRITDLLSELPKIRDHRHPNDIYQQISSEVEKRKRATWIIPSFAAMAAALLLFLLTPGFLKGDFSFSGQNASKSAEPLVKQQADKSKKNLQRMEKTLSKPSLTTSDSLMNPTALYENDSANERILTYWIPDKQAQNLIPITTTVLADSRKTWVDLLNMHMTDLKEEQMGLSDYFPLQAQLKLEQSTKTVIADVRTNNPYAQGSNSTIFQKALQNIVQSNSDAKKILLTTNGTPGIYFGDFGLIKELDVKQSKNRAYFFYQPEGIGIPYLVPSAEPFNTIKEALAAMTSDVPTSGLHASLGAKFQVFMVGIDDKRTLNVTMKPDVKMVNDSSSLYSFEALLLTAKDFGLDNVKIMNATIEKLGPFNLQVANKVPLGANYRSIQ